MMMSICFFVMFEILQNLSVLHFKNDTIISCRYNHILCTQYYKIFTNPILHICTNTYIYIPMYFYKTENDFLGALQSYCWGFYYYSDTRFKLKNIDFRVHTLIFFFVCRMFIIIILLLYVSVFIVDVCCVPLSTLHTFFFVDILFRKSFWDIKKYTFFVFFVNFSNYFLLFFYVQSIVR